MTVVRLCRLACAFAFTTIFASAAARAQGARPTPKPSPGVLRKVMTEPELTAYVKSVHGRIVSRMSPAAKANAEQIVQSVKAANPAAGAVALSASGLWLAGHAEEALYAMGVACADEPTSADNLNNYAAFISMAGAPDVAMPILVSLNHQYPGNSTVLNNIGQAWYGLGNTQAATAYLDSAIRVFAHHSQANQTLATIKLAKGDKAGAIENLKNSLQESYSQNRMSQLEKLGGHLNPLPAWGFHMPQDALGLEKLVPPKYPQELGELESLRRDWETFRDEVQRLIDDQKAKEQALVASMASRKQSEEKQAEQAGKAMDVKALQAMALRMQQTFPPFYPKAMAKLRSELGEEGGGMVNVRLYRQMLETQTRISAENAAAQKQWDQELAPIYKQMVAQSGEGMANNDEGFCDQINAIGTKYLVQINQRNEEYGHLVLEDYRKATNTRAYYMQYATPGGDDEVKLMEVRTKLDYAGKVKSLPVLLEGRKCSKTPRVQKSGMGKLADFYDLHCDNKVSGGVPGVWSISAECNKLKVSFVAGPAKANWTENLETGVVTNGSVELELNPLNVAGSLGRSETVAFSRNIWDQPYSSEIKAKLGIKTSAFLEIENGQVSDFGVEVAASASNNLSIGSPNTIVGSGGSMSQSIGIKSRIGWNSGATTTGTGLLKGLTVGSTK